ncbi:hypothetical protein [Spongiimicrobium sp. 2-473A-2-J]|uniref:hypothetical protein n=1 Tax=Eudoraea algarum TaxID=3417568 RepID=UPI003D36155A
MKKLPLIGLLCLGLLLANCGQERDTTFLITHDSVGKLYRTSTAAQLDSIYVLDSIVRDSARLRLGKASKKIKIYERGGTHLLTLTLNADSVPKIENVRIYDPRFVTDKGVGLSSTFKDIKKHYTIHKVITSLNNVVIFPKESAMYFTIDKEELPPSLRYTTSTNIEAVQIPDDSRIKYLMVGWE